MKKINVSVSYDEEKLSTLRLYLEQKGMQVEDELTKSLDALYTRNVPAGVREFLNLRSGIEVKTVQNNLGHKDATVTLNTYAIYTEDMGRVGADKFAAYWAENTQI